MERCHGLLLFAGAGIQDGQPEGERGSPAGLAVDFDAALMAADDLFDYGQSQPDTEALRAVKGLEDFVELVGGNAAARYR